MHDLQYKAMATAPISYYMSLINSFALAHTLRESKGDQFSDSMMIIHCVVITSACPSLANWIFISSLMP